MENLTKFSTATTTTSSSDSTSLLSCAGGGAAVGLAAGIGLASGGISTPPVSAHTSTWLAALHVNNNNNTDKSFNNVKDTHHHHHNTHHICGNNLSTSMGVVSNLAALPGPAWQCESCDMYQKNGGKAVLSSANTIGRVALIEEEDGVAGGTSTNKVIVCLYYV